MSLEERLAEIDQSPDGPQVAAFFDFDGTLIDGYSAFALMQERWRRRHIGPTELLGLTLLGVRGLAGSGSFDELMELGVRSMAGRREDELQKLGRGLTRGVLGGLLFREALDIVEAHHSKGHTVVVASSALPFQIEPLAGELGIDHVLCTRPTVIDGALDGTIDGAILWGARKAQATEAFSEDNDVDLDASFGYANGTEDLEFLSVVGHPRAINPTDELARVAEDRGWAVERFAAKGRPGVTDAARTVAAYSGMAASFGVGLGLGLLNRSRRDAVNISMAVGSDVALTLAGVHLDVQGAGHLWSERPAVFVFNHQSWLDGLVVMRLLREDVTGVAKREVASQPGFGQFAQLAGMAFVDRDAAGDPRDALAPAVARLEEGMSIVIAPEGTRSTTPRLGRFKKGAFHLAMQAGVPVVPIVLRNAGDLLWRGSKVIRPGTVDVLVHAPIPTTDWTAADIGDHVEEIRGLFLETLADWPYRARPALGQAG